MRQAQLAAPEPWVRMVAVIGRDGRQFSAMRIGLFDAGAVAAPILGVSGVTQRYRCEVPGALLRERVRFLVQIDSRNGEIVEAGPPGLELDAEFAGTQLTQAQLDTLWQLSGQAPSDQATFDALKSGTATLPQSGDGTPGGRFHSWFEVLP
jgi:hypothetical protein